MTVNHYLPQPTKIISIKRQTDIDYTFTIDTSATGMVFAGGQFVEVSLPKVGECPISISDFGADWLEMTIRRVGKVTNVLHQLQAGDTLFIRGPYGNGFPLEQYRDQSLIIAAGGTALAPVKSIITRHYDGRDPMGDLTLLAGFKSPGDILFGSELEQWREKLAVTVTVDQGHEGWPGHVGLITKYVQQLEIPNPGQTQVIVVGPPLMMKFTVAEFISLGVPEQNITVSFERKMCCGIGKCGHCKIDDTYVCLEGPVFNYARARHLID